MTDELEALRAENAHLRAHVAALVKVIHDTLRGWPHLAIGGAAHIALQQALDAPDLAALLAREQARERELHALRRFKAAYDVCDSHRGAFSCTDAHDLRCLKARGRPDAACECGRDELDAAGAALDAGEQTP
jgi:hypothetical protein